MLKKILILWMLAMPAWASQMLELNYLDQEKGTPAVPMRILITDQFMRIDDGNNKSDFLLLDRQEKRIFNVTHDRQEILKIDAGVVTMQKPAKWVVREEVTDLPKQGKGAKKVNIFVNDTMCMQITAVEGFLPDAVSALRRYNETLAQVQAQTFMATPPELQNDCDLAQTVFEFGRELKYGLPLEATYHSGNTRRMVGYHMINMDSQLFTLPKQYRTVSLDDIRGAK
ncbi:hypothetical protein [Sulfurirhabdus autotrophica]|uniref:DUF4412 domain-containing protein n=1 Tax=Sulfurirhabdus autotrophica TaxID=1706046 RepID=A0A4R3YDA6_9PROT|nr:hypothetical protein [Sulfurirhabdus autotrophica]TCV90465.1 hypothetical protein EDC63_101438 [Sulfurirhabdus autotrophica]